jgi:hypothetical protein
VIGSRVWSTSAARERERHVAAFDLVQTMRTIETTLSKVYIYGNSILYTSPPNRRWTMSDVPNATHRRLLDPDGFLMESSHLLDGLSLDDRLDLRKLINGNYTIRQAFVQSVQPGCAGDAEIDKLHDMSMAHYKQEKEVAAKLQAARAAVVVPARQAPAAAKVVIDLTSDSDSPPASPAVDKVGDLNQTQGAQDPGNATRNPRPSRKLRGVKVGSVVPVGFLIYFSEQMMANGCQHVNEAHIQQLARLAWADDTDKTKKSYLRDQGPAADAEQ